MNNLPDTVYVTRIQDDREDDYSWLTTEENIENLAVKGETRTVGVYKLVEVMEVTLEVTERVITKKS
jgi:hypothetical protein